MNAETPPIPASASRAAARRLSGFDVFALAGGLINLVVIVLLIGYSLLH